MIKARFFTENDSICGFEINGHSGSAEKGEDIICASVSSAAYMAANTVTEIIGFDADIKVDDGYISFYQKRDSSDVQAVLKGLRLHLESLSQDYPENIKVTSLRRCQNA